MIPCQYYHQTDTYKGVLHYMNTTLTGLFTLECAMKIFSYGFRVGGGGGVGSSRTDCEIYREGCYLAF